MVGVLDWEAGVVLLTLFSLATAYFRMEETNCYSCASEDYKLVWDLEAKSRKPISTYLNAPRKFSTLCSNPDAFRTFAAVTKCNFTCLSILEPTVAGGIYQDNMFMRGCADNLFKVPSSFQVCACKWNQCNTHPQLPQNVNRAALGGPVIGVLSLFSLLHL